MDCWNSQPPVKRVLHIVMRWGEGRGGVKQFIRNTMDALPGDRYEQKVLSVGPITSDCQGFPLFGPVVEHGGAFSLLVAYASLRNKLSEIGPDIVHIHCNNGLGFLYAAAAKHSGCRIRIVHSHSTSLGDDGFAKRIINVLLMLGFNRSASERVACSQSAGEFLFSKRPFEIVKNGIDLGRFRFDSSVREEIRKRFGIKHNALVLGHVGSGIPVKNTSLIVDIVNELTARNVEVHAFLIGTGPEIRRLQERVEEYDLNAQVHFIGFVSDVWRYYSAMDMFMLPSFYEGLPICLIEAQANGLPCVVSNSVSKDANITGLISNLSLEDDLSVWVDLVLSLASRQDSTRLEQSEISACKLTAAGFSLATLCDQLDAIYLKSS